MALPIHLIEVAEPAHSDILEVFQMVWLAERVVILDDFEIHAESDDETYRPVI